MISRSSAPDKLWPFASASIKRLPTLVAQRLRTAEAARSFWALADQGVVSVGTFLTSVVLARFLTPSEYGVYALICGMFYFLNSLHSALIALPLSSRGALADADEIRRLASCSIALTLCMTPPLAILLGGLTWALGRPDLFPWAIAAICLWQVQETMRRAFMSHLKHQQALWGDMISYLGQAGLIWICVTQWQLPVKWAFLIMALTSAVAGLTQIVQHGLKRAELAAIYNLGASYWSRGRWILIANLLGFFLYQAYPWMLAYFHGAAASAQYYVTINILGVSHPIIFGIASLIYPAATRAQSESGVRQALRVGFGYVRQGAFLLAPFYLILFFWPQSILRLFYGANSPYLNLSWVLRLFVLNYLCAYLSAMMEALLNSLGRAKMTSISQLTCALTTISLGLPLTIWWDVAGAVGGRGLSLLTLTLVSGFSLRQATNYPETKGPAESG